MCNQLISKQTLPLCSRFSPADCPEPPKTDVFALTRDSLLVNSFPEGIRLSFECPNGYINVDGSGFAECQNSVWSNIDLTCQSESCSTLTVTLPTC